jgi:DNA-directed RNA polymerase subunit L
MSVKISNIVVSENSYGDLAKKIIEKYSWVDMTDERRAILKKLTPRPTHSLTFDLINANTDLANAFRRTMLDSIVWPRLTCSMEDIKTDDPFVQRMTDYFQNRLWLVPTAYAVKSDTKWEFRIDTRNQTTEPVIVKSAEIQVVKAPPKFDWDRQIDLIELLPGRALKVNITIEWGSNLSHASFSNFSGLQFWPLEYLKSENVIKDDLPRSTTVHPTDYRLGFTCENFVEPLKAARMGWESIRESLITADRNIEDFESQKSVIPYLSTGLNVTHTKGDVTRYEFFNETYTLGNLIYRYSYMVDPTVEYMFAGDDHPEDRSILVKIRHKEHSKLLRAGIAKALKDVEICVKAF